MITARKASIRVRVRARCARARADPRRGGEGYRRGVAQPQDAPERSQRAQRAQRALPDAGSVPTPPAYRNASSTVLPAIGVERDASAGRSGAVQGYPEAHPGGLGEHKARDTLCPKPAACHTPRRIAMQARPHRWNATRQPGGAGRCGTVVMGDRVWWRPPSKARKSCTGCTSALCYGATHGTEPRACWRKTSGRRDTHRPWSRFLIATGAAASPTGARTARRRHRPERPRARACCWHVLRGG